MVVLAQLVEHRIVVPSVVGSSPTFHPKQRKYHLVSPLFFARMYGLETIVPLWLRTHFIGIPENFNSWGERSARRKRYTRD